MHTHNQSRLTGPVSGARPWWRQLETTDNTLPSTKREPMFRAALVEQIRMEIAKGTYDTPEKWDIALDRLLKRLDGENA
jgi:hypothetical protein